MNIHHTTCQASCLSDTNLVAHGHVLNALHLLYQNLFFLQPVDRERHGKTNAQWKAFWDSNDQNNDGNYTNLSTF